MRHGVADRGGQGVHRAVHPARAQKRKELLALSQYDWSDYVTKQGWANMPGEDAPDPKVAEACARLVAS